MNSNAPRKYAHIDTDLMSASEPRVLNIHLNDEVDPKLPVVNLNASSNGQISIEDLLKLPYDPEHFVIVRVINVLQDVPDERLPQVLSELKRVLHRFGELHIGVPSSMSINPLKQHLVDVGFDEVSTRKKEDDLAFHCEVNDASQASDQVLLTARQSKIPHDQDTLMTEKMFSEKSEAFLSEHPNNPSASFVVAIYNEEKNLPAFLTFLENSTNRTQTRREFIFVINGCTDNSEKVVRAFLKDSKLNAKVVSSGIGIVSAFIKGIEERELDGFIGKLDADVILQPYLLDLMQMHLVENETVQVTYGEPMPVDSECEYNVTDHHPEAMTKRLYYTSKASLNRVDPFAVPAVRGILEGFRAEDMFMSFYFVYFYGLDSISRAPHGYVYAKTVHSYDDLVKQISRMNSEMEREFMAYPAFRVLANITEQEFYPGPYKAVFERALKESTYVDEWTRIQSTK